jgi:multidrug efflux pump
MSLGTLLTIFVVPTMYTLLARKFAPGPKKEATLPSSDQPEAAQAH